jgi:hypothetical protein
VVDLVRVKENYERERGRGRGERGIKKNRYINE